MSFARGGGGKIGLSQVAQFGMETGNKGVLCSGCVLKRRTGVAQGSSFRVVGDILSCGLLLGTRRPYPD